MVPPHIKDYVTYYFNTTSLESLDFITDFIKKQDIVALKSDFQVSHQLLLNENSGSERMTVTKVHVVPGKTNNLHNHESSAYLSQWISKSVQPSIVG